MRDRDGSLHAASGDPGVQRPSECRLQGHHRLQHSDSALSIEPATELPLITDPVVIDGTTQPGFVDKPIVELAVTPCRQEAAGSGSRAGESSVRGLVVNRFSDQIVVGVEPPPGRRERRYRIVGNYLGTDLTGAIAAGGNGNGIGIIARR